MASSFVPFIQITGFVWWVVHPKMAHRVACQFAFIFTVHRWFLFWPMANVSSVIIFETTVCWHNSLAGHSWGGHTLFNVYILQFTKYTSWIRKYSTSLMMVQSIGTLKLLTIMAETSKQLDLYSDSNNSHVPLSSWNWKKKQSTSTLQCCSQSNELVAFKDIIGIG